MQILHDPTDSDEPCYGFFLLALLRWSTSSSFVGRLHQAVPLKVSRHRTCAYHDQFRSLRHHIPQSSVLTKGLRKSFRHAFCSPTMHFGHLRQFGQAGAISLLFGMMKVKKTIKPQRRQDRSIWNGPIFIISLRRCLQEGHSQRVPFVEAGDTIDSSTPTWSLTYSSNKQISLQNILVLRTQTLHWLHQVYRMHCFTCIQ